ncbi:ribose-5-phosphate isomerase RpiA [Pullulanibacillus sp. KACC 23026]|uniref:ribose-5-phosphate isomerase RpiA n=1 Tax=Pullulanibacillus sp. KACC 23026 TaxID=3028315 RepID=UPI0023B17FAF|nr:ribose-5-phosphate isomerase RpiA [Pullulanibacillus sp. KACC 23026]WEG11999.1 ribose-5-phosphate isomerase RpiA [Pullulanibacillus sp. KACC 23026]
MEQVQEKQLVGEYAAKYVEDGMIVGLGTGSTAYYTIHKIAQRVKEEGMKLTFVSTSTRTTKLAQTLGLTIHNINDVPEVDLTIDGCDEFDPQLKGIKGGGGALLFEKIIATSSKQNIWVADRSKKVEVLGAFPLPVEVLTFGSSHTIRKFEKEGLNPSIRKKADGSVFITDSQNLVVDLHLSQIEDPEGLSIWLNSLPGVVENGLFLGIADRVIYPKADGSIEEVNA